MGRIRIGLTLCIVATALVAITGCGGDDDETDLPGPAVPAKDLGGTASGSAPPVNPEGTEPQSSPSGGGTGEADVQAYADCLAKSITDAQLAACAAAAAEGP